MSEGIASITSVSDLLERLGLSATARAFGHVNASTVSSWKARGRIPVEHWPAVIDLGRKHGFPIDAEAMLKLHTADAAAAPSDAAA